ncbi:MAG: gliding motility-associated C-terminal domain-containing protein, partial [Bacteroidetes bacterium]|nr:gliding motility-associated C-terminal domain-containing protein [Bacteroidota bacterium]
LNGKKFFFDLCPAAGSNFEPVSALLGYCDSVKVCGNDTIFIKNTFLGPEAGQTVTVTASAPTLGSSFSFSTSINPNGGTDIYIIIDGSTAPAGYHTISISATDDGVPALTNGQQVTVYVDQVSVNNLNGSIVVTPTLGACPGGVVTASVSVSGGTPDSYLWSNGNVNASTTFTTFVASDSLIFVTLTSGQCSKTIIGDININPVPVANISGILSYCNGGPGTVLTATNTLNPANQGPHTYAWSTPSGTLSSTTSPTVNVNAGVYSVTVTNQYGCVSAASTTVTINETPVYTLTPANAMYGSVFCVSTDSARIAINFGGSAGASCGLANSPCVVTNTILVGTGSTNGTSSTINPFVSFWESSHHQYLYKASELIAAGVQPGKLSSIGINLATLSTETLYPGFTVKIKCTSANSVSSFDNSGLSLVYQANTTINLGLNTLNFNQPYLWDGTSNILIDVCHGVTSGIPSNSQAVCSITPFTSVVGDYDSGSGSLCGGSNTSGTSSTRPNIVFGNCLAKQSGSQFTVVVTPSTGVVVPTAHDSIKFPLPGTAGVTCYTVSLINPIGSCAKDTVICLTTAQGMTQGTLAVNNSSVCLGQPVTLTAQGALTSYTIQYVDGSGLQTTTVSPVTFNAPSTIGMYTYTLNAIGPCGAPLASFTNTINVVQGVTQGTLSLSADTLCPGSNLTLSALGSLASYTIAYVDGNGNSQVSVNAPATFAPASTSNPVFGVHTYTLIAEGPCSGPVTAFTNTVYIRQGTTNATLVATPTVVCVGTPVTLTANGSSPSSLATYTISYNNGTISNSVNSPVTFNTAVVGTNIYTLQAQGACSAPITTYTASVAVSGLLNLSIAPMANVNKCANGTVTLTANVASSPAQPYSYSWSPAVGVSTNSIYVTSTPVTTTFVVTVNGTCASPATASVVVTNYASDINVSIVDSAAICANTALVLNTMTSGGKPSYSYNWTLFPDVNSISTSSSLNISAPSTEGTYVYMITSTDSCGFTDSDLQVITVLPPCAVEVPNIITPNGDGANDYFKIKNIEYHPNSTLSIFDRWGKKVFTSTNYANEWKAEGLNDGTFFYILEVPDDKKYDGFVQVLR